MKTCRLCGISKPLAEFHKDKRSPDGHQYRCKPCAIADAHRRNLANPDRVKANLAKHRQTEKYKATRKAYREGPGRERVLTQKRESYERNREGIRERVTERRRANPEKVHETYERGYERRREEILAQNREWQHKNLDKLRYYRRKRMYGLEPEQFDALLVSQEGLCGICGIEMHGAGELHVKGSDQRRTGICVDHDHETGAVRGLICPGCNKGLGYFKDDPDRLLAAVEYLLKHRRT